MTDEYVQEHGDFMIGGMLFSELKHEFPEALKRTNRNAERIKRTVDDLRRFAHRDPGSLDDTVYINAIPFASRTHIHNHRDNHRRHHYPLGQRLQPPLYCPKARCETHSSWAYPVSSRAASEPTPAPSMRNALPPASRAG